MNAANQNTSIPEDWASRRPHKIFSGAELGGLLLRTELCIADNISVTAIALKFTIIESHDGAFKDKGSAMSEFYEGLAEILEVEIEDVTPALELEESVWDSLAVVSTIALIDEVFDRTVSADSLIECKTVGDIEKLLDSSATNL